MPHSLSLLFHIAQGRVRACHLATVAKSRRVTHSYQISQHANIGFDPRCQSGPRDGALGATADLTAMSSWLSRWLSRQLTRKVNGRGIERASSHP